jgi:hypothetical protein
MKKVKSTKETLRQIGRVASLISEILGVFVLVGAAFAAIGVIVAPFVDFAALQQLITDIATDNNLALSWDVTLLNLRNVEVVCVGALLNSAVEAVLLYFVTHLFRNIYEEGTPFTDKNVKCLVNIGIVSLIQSLGVGAVMGIVYDVTGTEALFHNVFTNGPGFIIALFVFALSLVFKYGVELQKEADATL